MPAEAAANPIANADLRLILFIGVLLGCETLNEHFPLTTFRTGVKDSSFLNCSEVGMRKMLAAATGSRRRSQRTLA
jgi:hypothetical protein